jgi:hypothetical protein
MINQVRFANEVVFFKDNFIKKWGLKDYNNINEPCLFFGVYSDNDINIIKKHKGLKIVWFTNYDKNDLEKKLIGVKDLVINHTEGLKMYDNLNYKKTKIAIKDFSLFTPTPLGDKVYCYIGKGHTGNKHGFPIVEELKKMINFEIIYGKLGYDINYIIKNYYNESFININITESGRSGLTTLTEMGFMGRYSISNTIDKFPCVIKYNNIEDIVGIINKESLKIGTTPKSLLSEYFSTGDEWKYEEFWLS